MFDERSINTYLAVSDQCHAVCSCYEQARHARARLKAGEDDEGKEMAKDAIAEYADSITELGNLLSQAEKARVPVGSVQALIMKLLPQEALKDALEMQTV